MNNPVTPETLRRLAEFDTCTVANAVESFAVRLRNVGFSNSTLSCRMPQMPAMVGQAVTLRVRSSEPSMKAAFYLDQSDWWERLDIQPGGPPRVLVIEDVDSHPGRGALVGSVHACILKALGCVGVVTNGAVRALETFEDIGLQAFSVGVSPSHAYGHVVVAGVPVEVAGLRIEPGEIVHGDRHGVVTIPSDLAARLPEVAGRLRDREKRMCQFCASAGFSTSALRRLIEGDAGRS
jgi:4-hydroxy-4-methyl-2-oxoglutarate aldolase